MQTNNNKKRLLEVFSKVNKLPLNEQFNQEQMDNFVDAVEEDVMWYFNRDPKMFAEGIPNELNFQLQEQNVKLEIDEQEPIDFEKSIEQQLQYKVIYNFILNNIAFELFIPVTVNVEKSFDSGKIKFYTEIWFDKNYIQLQLKQ